MNICSVAYTFYEIDYRVRRYAEALVEKGNRVEMISLRGKGQKRHGRLNGVNIFRIQRREFDEQRLHNYIFRNMQFFIRASAILLIKHLKYRYKIIHIHNVPDFLVFVGLLPKLMGAKIILDIHDILPEFYCQKFGKTIDSALAKLMLLIEKMSVRFADHVIVANDLWREKIIDRDKILASNCTTILNYPFLGFFERSSVKSKKHHCKIIYPGTLSHHHGVDIAIKALSIVKTQIQTVTLDIYTRSSNSEYYSFLVNLIEDSQLQENVTFFEPVPAEQLGIIYRSANLGIAPKRTGIFASEAFSTKILDFMAAGLPVIASRTTVDEYYFDDSMIMFFEPENAEDVAKCIIELYKNPSKAQSLADNAQRFVDKNNWEAKKHIYFDIVDSLVKAP